MVSNLIVLLINRYITICLNACLGSSPGESDTFLRVSCNFVRRLQLYMVLKKRSFVIVMIRFRLVSSNMLLMRKKEVPFFFKKSQLCGKKFSS